MLVFSDAYKEEVERDLLAIGWVIVIYLAHIFQVDTCLIIIIKKRTMEVKKMLMNYEVYY